MGRMRMSKDFRTTTAALEAHTSAEALGVGGPSPSQGVCSCCSGYSVAISNQGEAIFSVSDIPAERNIGQASQVGPFDQTKIVDASPEKGRSPVITTGACAGTDQQHVT